MEIQFNDDFLNGEIIIDRPLTIFTGRNGTGKSYAAKRIEIKGQNNGLLPSYYTYLNQLIARKYISEKIAAIACEMELAIFGAEITPGDIRTIYTKEGKDLFYNCVPHSLKHFSKIILKLKYGTLDGGLFILDLPETNQHPENQILIARFIAKLANAGLKVVLITHSDYILRELNNMIILGAFEENERGGQRQVLMNEWGIAPDMPINAKNVRAYNFSGGRVIETEVTNEGVSAEHIDEAIQKAQAKTEDIYKLLGDEYEG